MVIVVVMVTGPFLALFFDTVYINMTLSFYFMSLDLLLELQDTQFFVIVNIACVLIDQHRT